MDAAARRAKPNRGRPLVPPNYVSLRDLQELRLKEEEERRRREEEEAEARRVREEQRRRQEEEEAVARRVREEQRKRQEEEEAAARRFVEERRRRAEEAAARRARDAAAAEAPRPEMRASSSSHASSFRSNERARGGQRLVAVADRPPPPPPRGECAAVKIGGATGGCPGQKGTDGGAANAPLPQNVGRGKVSAGIAAACPGEPAKPAAASSHAGKPEEKRKGEDSGCQGKMLLGAMPTRTSNASGEPAKVDIASYGGPARPNQRHQQRKKGFDGRSTETAMTCLIAEAVEASPLPVGNLENKGKSRSGDWSNETASANIPGKAAEASPPRGVKSDNKGKKKPSGGKQASAAPSSDLRDGKKVEALGCEGTASGVSSAPGDQADAGGASYGTPLRPMYKRKGKNGLDVRSTEKATAIVTSKATDASPLVGANLEIKGKNGLIDQGTEIALARLPGKAADASLARGFKSENRGKKEPSGGRHAGMAPSTDCPDGMKTQPCLAADGNGNQRSSGVQVTTWEAKTKGLQGKQTVVEVKAQQHPATENISYLRSGGDEGVIQAAKSEGSEEKQRVVEMRTTAQLKSCDMRNSGRQRSGGYSRVNVTARQHSMVWVPKAAAVPESVEVGKFP